MTQITAAITGVAGYVPPDILTNADLEKMVDTNDQWIVERTGIKERRILKGEEKGTSVLASRAVNSLIEKTGIDPLEVDALICATATPDMGFISTANLVTDLTGCANAMSFDVAAACTGFLYALENAVGLISSGRYKKVIVVGADMMSSVLDYSDRKTCIIFGDGAGAVLVEPNQEGFGVQDTQLNTDATAGKHLLHVKVGGSKYPYSESIRDNGDQYFFQDGKSVFRHAVTKMAAVSQEVMKRNGLTGNDVKWVVPHQANMRIIEAIQRYGNTTGATIPLCLWEWEEKFRKGDNIVMAAFGGGFTWGATYMKWAYNA
jgi:3-oxoacyl-[acyl-carrier-protein] synthase-3